MKDLTRLVPDEGSLIEVNLDPYGIEFAPKRAKVIDQLSVQFTAEWQDGTRTLSYLFYNDVGATWRPLKGD